MTRQKLNMSQEWQEQYLEDILYLKSEDVSYGRLFDKMEIMDPYKRNWLEKYCNLHRQNEQKMWESNGPQLELPKNLHLYIHKQ